MEVSKQFYFINCMPEGKWNGHLDAECEEKVCVTFLLDSFIDNDGFRKELSIPRQGSIIFSIYSFNPLILAVSYL